MVKPLVWQSARLDIAAIAYCASARSLPWSVTEFAVPVEIRTAVLPA